jgi:hypothetical protein
VDNVDKSVHNHILKLVKPVDISVAMDPGGASSGQRDNSLFLLNMDLEANYTNSGCCRIV